MRVSGGERMGYSLYFQRDKKDCSGCRVELESKAGGSEKGGEQEGTYGNGVCVCLGTSHNKWLEMKHWSPETLHSHLQMRQICPMNCPAPNAQWEALGQEKLEVILDAPFLHPASPHSQHTYVLTVWKSCVFRYFSTSKCSSHHFSFCVCALCLWIPDT